MSIMRRYPKRQDKELKLFPSLYHAHHSRHPDDLPFWLELANQPTGSARGGILELGCGTGRVLLPLAQAGLSVYGLDNDYDMLAFLQQQLDRPQTSPETRRRVHFWQGDLTAFCLGRRFGLILLPCNTLSTLDAAERAAMLDCTARHLRPGGLFAASLPNPRLLRRLPAVSDPELEEEFPHPEDGAPVEVWSGWERSGGFFRLQWTYDHPRLDGNVERLTVQVNHHLVSPQTYLDEAIAAGLEVVETYGDFDRSAYHPQADNLIFVARKA
jgi:SAM-dependent methyltransferase